MSHSNSQEFYLHSSLEIQIFNEISLIIDRYQYFHINYFDPWTMDVHAMCQIKEHVEFHKTPIRIVSGCI